MSKGASLDGQGHAPPLESVEIVRREILKRKVRTVLKLRLTDGEEFGHWRTTGPNILDLTLLE